MGGELGIVIVTYNSVNVIVDLLESIPAALGSLSARVVIVDNGSRDGTADYVAALNLNFSCHLVRSSNRGYAAGVNEGAKRLGDVQGIVVLNPDVRLCANSIELMASHLGMPHVGIVCPAIYGADGRREPSLRREPTLRRALGLGFTGMPALSEYVTDDAEYLYEHPVDWATGAALLVKRELHDLLGGWDESYFLYSEETDFCLRAREFGYLTIFEPTASVIHIGGASGRNGTTHAMQILNRVRLYVRRNGAGTAGWLYFALTLLSEVTWIVRGHAPSCSSVTALVCPGRRPVELTCGTQWLPR